MDRNDDFKQVEEEVKKMLERMAQRSNRYDDVDVVAELARYKRETGYDFLELMRDPELRARADEENALKTDTDEDTMELMKSYEPWARILLEADEDEDE